MWLLWLLLLPVFWLACSDQSTPDTGKKRPIKLKYMVTTQHESIVKDVPIEVPALADTVTFATIQANVPAELKDYEFNSTEDKKIIDGVVVIKMHKKAAAKPTVTFKYTSGTDEFMGGTDFMFFEL